MLIFGKVNEGFDFTSCLEELFPPCFVGFAEGAGVAADGGAALLLGFGGEGVAEGFDLGEVEAGVDEGAFGEFAGFCVADA